MPGTLLRNPCIWISTPVRGQVCPVDCIHPRKDEVEFEGDKMLYIVIPDTRIWIAHFVRG